MILVTGSTGKLGAATIQHLLNKTDVSNIKAFARDINKAGHLVEQGIETRIGSFDDIASLDNAMQGIEKVLLVSGLDHNRFQQHKNVVDAAKNAGVKHIIYTSLSINDVSTSALKSLMESHFQTEDYIKESGLKYTILRNTLYADGIPMFVGAKVFETGIYLPTAEGKVPYALRNEMAEAAANVLLQNEHNNKTYEISGNELYSFQDIANVLSELSGKTVQYTNADTTTFPTLLKQWGVPDYGIYIVSGFSADIKDKQFEIVSGDLEKLLGRKPLNLKESLKTIYQL